MIHSVSEALALLEKSAVIKQDPITGKWILWTKDGKRKLGSHDTAQDAHKQEYAIQKSQEKSAAEMKRKTTMVERHSDHCPHCDFEFREKCYPRWKKDGKDVEDRAAAYDSGDYDEHCPECDGIIDQPDTEPSTYFANSPSVMAKLNARRETQRKRKAARDAARCAHGVVTPFNTCDECSKSSGTEKSAELRPIGERMRRLRDRRGECHTCKLPNLPENMKCTCGTEKSASVSSLLRRARNVTHTHPTPAQISAGNYSKGEFKWNSMRIKIENPEGTSRSGVDPSGKKWTSVMKGVDYGYFAGTVGKDGDPIDVFVGPELDSNVVAVIDQEIGGKFDEHKVVIGIETESDARHHYLAQYQKGWKMSPITMTTSDYLKKWLSNGEHKKRFAGQQKEAAWWHDRKHRIRATVASLREDKVKAATDLRRFPNQVGHLILVAFHPDWPVKPKL